MYGDELARRRLGEITTEIRRGRATYYYAEDHAPAVPRQEPVRLPLPREHRREVPRRGRARRVTWAWPPGCAATRRRAGCEDRRPCDQHGHGFRPASGERHGGQPAQHDQRGPSVRRPSRPVDEDGAARASGRAGLRTSSPLRVGHWPRAVTAIAGAAVAARADPPRPGHHDPPATDGQAGRGAGRAAAPLSSTAAATLSTSQPASALPRGTPPSAGPRHRATAGPRRWRR